MGACREAARTLSRPPDYARLQLLLGAEGRVIRTVDERGDAYAIIHPALPQECGLVAGRKWIGVNKHGGAEKAHAVVQSQLLEWREQFRAKRHAALSAVVCLRNRGAVGEKLEDCDLGSEDVFKCVKWYLLGQDTYEYRLVSATHACAEASNATAENLASIVRKLLGKRCMQKPSQEKSDDISTSPGGKKAKHKSKGQRQQS